MLVTVTELVAAEGVSTNAVERFVRYQFTLTNQRGETIPDADLWVRAPVKLSSHQRCISVETAIPYELITDEQGNQTLHFSFKGFPPYGRKIITVKSTVELTSVPVEVAIDPAKYLGAAPLMELDSPEFKALTPQFGAGKAEVIAKTAMNWVRQNVQDAGYQKRDHGALYALQEKKGDCTEQTYLFAALCRAHGIPARVFGGYICKQNAILGPMGYHLWVEFFDGTRWQLVDPQNGVFAGRGADYVALCEADGAGPLAGTERFRVSGEGLTVKMD